MSPTGANCYLRSDAPPRPRGDSGWPAKGDRTITAMDSTSLMLGILFGSIGVGYFVYGKKQQRFVAMVCGGALMALPYVVSSPWAVTGLSLVAMALPFAFRV
jgi:hypothetical protein